MSNLIWRRSENGLTTRTAACVTPFTLIQPHQTASDPLVDADDEICLLAKDAADPAPRGMQPDGVAAGSGVEIRVSDPLAKGVDRYLYVFRRQPDIRPQEWKAVIDYRFRLKAGIV